jgi:uncharacterized protein YpuA (DUF1002 family)
VKSPNFFLVATILIVSATAQVSKTDVAVSELRTSHPAVNWNSKSATVADVTCDGKSDTVILGSEKNNVVVGVVSGANPTKTQVFSFPVSRSAQDAFCASPHAD